MKPNHLAIILATLAATGSCVGTRARRSPLETPNGALTPDDVKHISPAITQAPLLFGSADIAGRAVGFDRTCGFYSADLASPVRCDVGYTCTTSSSILDCCSGSGCRTSKFDTSCLDSAACQGIAATALLGTYCCTFQSTRPYCTSFLWSSASNGDTKLFYNCGSATTSRLSILFNDPTNGLTTPTTSTTRDFPPTTSITSTTTTTIPPTPVPASGGSNTGAIVGGVVGGVAALGILGAGAFLLFRRRKRDPTPPEGPPTQQPQPSMQQYGAGAGAYGFAPMEQQPTGPSKADPRYSIVSGSTLGGPHGPNSLLGSPTSETGFIGMQPTGGTFQSTPSPGPQPQQYQQTGSVSPGFGSPQQVYASTTLSQVEQQPPPQQPQQAVWEAPANNPRGTEGHRAELGSYR